MAEIFNFYVHDNRTIQFPKSNLLEPIMQEDHKVATWRFRIPKVLNQIDMSGWSWWFVYVNAKGQTFSELLTLTDDIDEPSSYSTADYDIDYGISKFPGSFSFALEAINAQQGGEIDNEWHTKTYKHKVDGTLQGNQAEYAETESDVISALMQEVRNKVNQLVGGATPLPVNLKSLMVDHDKVYLYTGSETGESTGYWYYYNGTDFVPGGLYGAGVQIDAVPTQGSTNAVSSGGVYEALSGKVDKVVGKGLSTEDYTTADKQNVADNTYIISNIAESGSEPVSIATNYDQSSEIWTTTTGYFTSTGKVTGTSSANHGIWYFQAEEDISIYFTAGDASTISKWYMAIYSDPPLTQNTLVQYFAAGTLPTEEEPFLIEAGRYVAFCIYNMTNPDRKTFTMSVVDTAESIILKSTLGLTDTMDTEVVAKITPIQNTLTSLTDGLLGILDNNGYGVLPASAYSYGGLTAYATVDSRQYRIHTGELIFNRDITLLAKNGFYFVVRYSDERESGGEHHVENIPANTAFKIYLRRVEEDTQETANISTWANMLLFSTPIAPIERFKHTFSDVSMFERIGICGDSYAAGGGIISGITSLTWGKNLERQAGVDVDIYAKSGQTVMQWVADSAHGLPALLTGTECGLYWLQHGINGTSTAEALGTTADMSEDPHPQTFYGQYVEAIEQIKETFPNARIVIANIIGSHYGLYQLTYATVNEAIANIAEYCEIPLIDVAQDDFYRSKFYTIYGRSNHPTAMQNAGIAMANRRLISKCIQDNPEYFITYGSNS